jgi:APA family basic amino acid/polyamine antiporter
MSPSRGSFSNVSARFGFELPTSERTAGVRLVRGIRKWDLVALVLNSIVGAGIFGLPSRAYALAGVHSLLAYVVCAVPIFLIILCFAEVSSRFRDTGGPYLYARTAFGSVVGFEIGWLSWLVRLTAFAALCNLFVDYLSYFLPALGSGLGRVVVMTVIVSSLAAANLVGVRLASLVGNVFTVGKLVPLVLLVVVGVFFINPHSYSSVAPPSYSAFSASILLLVFAFTGFELAVIPAGEALDPRRHLPFALLAGTAIAVVLYVAIQAVCIGTLPDLASSQRPLADVGSRLFGRPGAAVISLGALISVTGTMNAIMLAAPRLLFAMAEQGQLPSTVSATHRRFHTPHVAILFSAVGMLVLTLSGTFASAATLSTIIRLTTYAVTCAALPVLRRSSGRAPFAAPAGGTVSVVALILIAWLFASSSWRDIGQTAIAGAAGLFLYAVLATRRGRTQHELGLETRY